MKIKVNIPKRANPCGSAGKSTNSTKRGANMARRKRRAKRGKRRRNPVAFKRRAKRSPVMQYTNPRRRRSSRRRRNPGLAAFNRTNVIKFAQLGIGGALGKMASDKIIKMLPGFAGQKFPTLAAQIGIAFAAQMLIPARFRDIANGASAVIAAQAVADLSANTALAPFLKGNALDAADIAALEQVSGEYMPTVAGEVLDEDALMLGETDDFEYIDL